jgi:hypothetical protein
VADNKDKDKTVDSKSGFAERMSDDTGVRIIKKSTKSTK